jgi:geranylgeranyl diphosphate synthase type I
VTASFLDDVRRAVDADLARFFSLETARARELSGDVLLVDALAALTMRGGKRLRPAVLVAAHRAVRPEGTIDEVLTACSALELLQTYLLVHDDWMDGDEVRRGGPSVHAALRSHVGNAQLGDALAILAGDLGCAYAWELLLDAGAMQPPRADVLRAFSAIQREVVLGQQLDVMGSPDVTRMHQLKTGSYTVRGPLRLGALLGGASIDGAALRALDAFADPIGEAFQIADDLLGTFGDPKKTGKPAGNDLKVGKRTSLVLAAEQRLDDGVRAPLTAVLGNADASAAQVAAASELLISSGIRDHVEGRLRALVSQAEAALDTPALGAEGRTLLHGLANAMAHRSA